MSTGHNKKQCGKPRWWSLVARNVYILMKEGANTEQSFLATNRYDANSLCHESL